MRATGAGDQRPRVTAAYRARRSERRRMGTSGGGCARYTTGTAEAGSGRQKGANACYQQRLTGGLVLNELQFAKQRRVDIAEFLAAGGLAFIAVLPGAHRHAGGLRHVRRVRQAGIGDTDEQRKQPRPENQGGNGSAVTA